MEDHILPPYYELLSRLLPDHLQRNERILKLLGASHDEMLDAEETVVLLGIYRRFMEVMLQNNSDPLLTERVKDAFITAVTDLGASLGAANTKGFEDKCNN